MIVIVASTADRTVPRISSLLRDRGERVICFDARDFPDRATLSLELSGERPRLILRRRQETVDLAEARAVWFCGVGSLGAAAPEDVSTPVAKFAREERRALLGALWQLMECPWVPGPYTAIVRGERKLLQLREARRLGFEVPPTLATNDRAALVSWYREHDGRLISKLLGQGFFRSFSRWMRYTERVTPLDLASAGAVVAAPAIYQPELAKAIEIRVTVVGDRIFAAEIHSQKTNRTKLDWRRYALARTPHRVHQLPPAVADRCRQLLRRLDLRYGGIDLILAPDGRYWFLEINPGGQFGWIEAETGLPITEALVDLLAELAGSERQVGMNRAKEELHHAVG